MRHYSLSILLSQALLFSARAGEIEGVKFDDKITIDGKALVLNGMGLSKATMLKVKVYVTALYLQEKTKKASEVMTAPSPKAVEMQFLRSIDKGKIISGWKEGLERNCGDDCLALRPKFEKFYSLIDSMKRKDRMKFIVKADETEVYSKQMLKGTVPGKDFAYVLMKVWFGPNPPNAELQHEMLGFNGAG